MSDTLGGLICVTSFIGFLAIVRGVIWFVWVRPVDCSGLDDDLRRIYAQQKRREQRPDPALVECYNPDNYDTPEERARSWELLRQVHEDWAAHKAAEWKRLREAERKAGGW